MLQNNYTCKIPVIGSEPMCTLNSEWTDQEVKLLLFHGNSAWSGKFQIKDNKNVVEVMELLALNEDKYFEETKKALTTQGGSDNFTYSLDGEEFTWKKQVGKKMAVKFGCVQVCEIAPNKVFEKITDKMIQSSIYLNDKLIYCENQNANLTSENQSLKDKLDELSNRKNEMESTLYSQFLSLLNEKKRKINTLETTLKRNQTNHNETTGFPSPDPFGTDTEIDSEEDEKNQSPSKVLICKNEDNFDSNEAFCSLPKRSRRNVANNTAQPGTSGVKTQTNKTKNMPKSVKDNTKATTTLPKKPGRKGKKESCVLGKIELVMEEESSKEDAFDFPIKSKTTQLSRNKVHALNKEVEFEKKEEPTEEKRPNDAVDSDRTPSGIEPLSLSKLDQEPKKCSDRTDQKVLLNCKGKKPIESRKEEVDQSFKTFSSSTLDLLNNLV